MDNRAFGTDGDLPWATVFDPAANARALSAIQAEGFRAASAIIDRFVRAAHRTAGQATEAEGGAAGEAGVPGAVDIERITRAWWSLAGQVLLGVLPAACPTGESGVRLDVADPGPSGELRLAAPAGGSGTVELWLHNRGGADHADIALRCSALLSHDGEVIDADAVRIDPAVVAMPRRSSRGVSVTVAVAAQVPPGTYRGTLLVVGEPTLWLPVTLTVAAP